ncbi:hypothetical protein B0J17DRAFT_706283 [Rhizoctonia solani]|nr:hypothetical protein B0J17DRAFT_706283 [Rhizoctonia solani]
MLVYSMLAVLSLVSINGVRAGNTTCLNNSMGWFTQPVRETPCSCGVFQVGNMDYIAPGDQCLDQLGEVIFKLFPHNVSKNAVLGTCCCNSAAFSLSMLCISCQYGVGSGVNGNYGIDAPIRSVPYMRTSVFIDMGLRTNHQAQKAVCNAKLKIPSYAYGPSWITTGECSGTNDTSTRRNGVFVTNNTSNFSTPPGGAYVPKGGVVGPILYDVHDYPRWTYGGSSSSGPVDATNTTSRSASTPVATMLRRQKVETSQNNMKNRAWEGSSRPLPDRTHSNNGLQAVLPSPLEYELPPL